MLWMALLLLVFGVVLTVQLRRGRSHHVWTAAAGTLVSFVAVIGASSIGPALLPVAGLFFAIAVMRADHARHSA